LAPHFQGPALRTTISVPAQFRGPPNSVNGGYACGLMGKFIEGPSTAVLRAPPPLDTPMVLVREGGVVRLESQAGQLIGEARPADAAAIPPAPAAPSLAAATRAAASFVGFTRGFHPICFTCGDKLAEGSGLRVFVGQLEGAAEGVVAGPWTPNPAFADDVGLAPAEVVWAALDCPGSVAWVAAGAGGGLLGTMSCQVLRRPRVLEPTIVLAWPVQRSGRKLISGTALYTETGELLAHSHQIWIGRAMVAEGGVDPAKAATAQAFTRKWLFPGGRFMGESVSFEHLFGRIT
jgi:hypothetical protein